MRRCRSLIAGALLLLGTACAVLPDDPRFQARQAGLLQSALAPSEQPATRPRLWYVGIGLYGESWSENDVADVGRRLEQQAAGFRVVPVVFSEYFRTMPERFPVPDRRSVEAAIASVAERARPGDVVLVYLSTHGAPGVLARSAGGRELEPVRLPELREWLAPLEGANTVLVVSACFSGSFIPGLRAENRIIVAAARADRTSFGCRPGAEHSVFGEAFLDALAAPRASLHAIVDDTLRRVSARERELAVTRPSLPQVSVGAAVAPLYDAPVF